MSPLSYDSKGCTAGHRCCGQTQRGPCMLACPHQAATLEQQLRMMMSSFHAVDGSEVELLCSDHTWPALPLRRSSDLELR